MPPQLISLAGILVLLLVAFLLSNAKRNIRFRVVAAAFGLQAGIAVLVLRTPWGAGAIQVLADGVAADAGGLAGDTLAGVAAT